MTPEYDATAAKPEPNEHMEKSDRKLDEIRRHVVQLEVITLSTIFFVALFYLQPSVEKVLGMTAASLLPFLFLTSIAWLAPVVNPEDDIRSRIKWGLSGLGAGGLLGGTTGTLIAGPIGTPIGALVGGVLGFVAGWIGGLTMDGRKKIFTQGEAREYLLEKRRTYPSLSFEKIIAATANPPSEDPNLKRIPMFISDGVIKCTKEDVDAWLLDSGWEERRLRVLPSSGQ